MPSKFRPHQSDRTLLREYNSAQRHWQCGGVRRTFAQRSHNYRGVTPTRPTRHVSVKDVAARSGVSFQTTSKVLNGKGSVSEATRARILRAAHDLGYRPNLQARSLVMRSTRAVGLVASNFGDPNLSRFVVGAEREARRQGFAVVIAGVEPEGSAGEYALPALMERRVDGILLAAPQMEEDRAAARALERTVPVVSLYDFPSSRVATVGSDHELTGWLATRHLIDKGHRVIAMVTGTRGVATSRSEGYRRALEEAGLAADIELADQGSWEIGGAIDATRRLLKRRPDITAVFAQSDTMAIGALSALHQLGRRVPEDCAVVGCDDIDEAAYTTPPLTTVRVPFFEAGTEAMRLLLSMIAAGSVSPRKLVLPVHLVIRASSGA
jgi:LacI family transcriptional regulator